jgi:voltage-gated potassium channel
MEWEYKVAVSQVNRRAVEKERQRYRREFVEWLERASALPLFLLSLVMIPILILSIVHPNDRPLREEDWLIWSIFAFEYLLRLLISPDRRDFFPFSRRDGLSRRYIAHRWIDLAVVLLPFLEPLRFLRALDPIRIVRGVRVGAFLAEGYEEERELEAGRDGQVTNPSGWLPAISAGITRRLRALSRGVFRQSSPMVLSVLVALVVLPAFVWWNESRVHIRGAAPTHIHTIFDAIWWTFSTVSTVGYGDRVPTTPEGYGVAILLMFAGIGLFVAATSFLANWILGKRITEASATSIMLDQLPVPEALDRYGREGWELTGLRLDTFYFKRRKLSRLGVQ